MRILQFFINLWFGTLMKLFVKLGSTWFNEVRFETDDNDRVKYIIFYVPKDEDEDKDEEEE